MVCALLTIALLSSCSIQEIFSDTVEFEANKGLQKANIIKGASVWVLLFLMYIILFQDSSAKSCTSHKKIVPLQPQNG